MNALTICSKMTLKVTALVIVVIGSFCTSTTSAHAAPASSGSTTVSAQLVSDNRQMTCPADTYCNTVSGTNNAVGSLNVKQTFSQISMVCVNFGFATKDALDAGDAVNLQFRDPVTSVVYDAVSVYNSSSAPQTDRTTCVDATSRPDLAALFQNRGKQKVSFSAYAQMGHAWLGSVSVTISD